MPNERATPGRSRVINHWRTQGEASLDIGRQIVANFGCADVIDQLRFQVLPCRDARGGPTLTCIAAYLVKEGAASPTLMVALYG